MSSFDNSEASAGIQWTGATGLSGIPSPLVNGLNSRDLPTSGHPPTEERKELRTNLFWKTLFLILIPLVFEVIFVYLLLNLSKRADLLARRLQDSQRMVAAADRSLKNSVELGLEVAFFITNERPATGFGKPLRRAMKNMQKEIDSLQSYSSKYPSAELSNLVKELGNLTEKTISMGISEREALEKSEANTSSEQVSELERTMSKVTFYGRQQPYLIRAANAVDAFVDREEELSGRISASERSLRQISQILLAVGICSNIAIAFWLNREFNKHILRRLELLVKNAERIAAGSTLLQTPPSHNEIGNLDMALHKLDNELRMARESEKAAFDNALDLICRISAHFLFAQMSPSCFRHLGETSEVLAGQNCFDLCFEQTDKNSLSNCLAEAKSKSSAVCELALRSSKNDPVYFICSAFWSDEESNYFCVFHNISERKKLETRLLASQERMQDLADSMPAGLLVLEAEEMIESVNEFLCQLLGAGKNELLGAPAAKVFQPDSYLRLKSTLAGSGSKEELFNDMDLQSLDGRASFPVEVQLSPYETKSGTARIAVIHDIREEKELEKLKREFLATLTHDIRTPLSSARSSITVLETGRFGEPGEHRQELAEAEASSTEIIELINGVLELARLSSGKAIEKNETIELSELCSELVEELSETILQSTMVFHYEAGQKYYCHGNLSLLSKMLAIFLKHAAERAPKNTSTELRLSRLENYLRIEITDQGSSLDEAERNLIIHGAGHINDLTKELALSIAVAINQGHGGNIILDKLPEGRNSLALLLPAFELEQSKV